MSIKALQWAISQEEVFSSAQKFVLIALANFASETGKSYPSVATICRITQQQDAAVRRALKGLSEIKSGTIGEALIADTGKRAGPTQQVKVWQLPEAACDFKDPQKRRSSNGEDPCKTPTRPPQDPHKTP